MTNVIRIDGSVAPLSEVKRGDRLIGPDGQGRTVVFSGVRTAYLFRVIPLKGPEWTCSSGYRLVTLDRTCIRPYAPQNILELPEYRRRRLQLFSSGVSHFDGYTGDAIIDPYFLGYWFGDGTKAFRQRLAGPKLCLVSIATADKEVKEHCIHVARQWGLNLKEQEMQGCVSYRLTTSASGRLAKTHC